MSWSVLRGLVYSGLNQRQAHADIGLRSVQSIWGRSPQSPLKFYDTVKARARVLANKAVDDSKPWGGSRVHAQFVKLGDSGLTRMPIIMILLCVPKPPLPLSSRRFRDPKPWEPRPDHRSVQTSRSASTRACASCSRTCACKRLRACWFRTHWEALVKTEPFLPTRKQQGPSRYPAQNSTANPLDSSFNRTARWAQSSCSRACKWNSSASCCPMCFGDVQVQYY